jgi:hypothetical protein
VIRHQPRNWRLLGHGRLIDDGGEAAIEDRGEERVAVGDRVRVS